MIQVNLDRIISIGASRMIQAKFGRIISTGPN
jgi:hypothetical protein